MKENNLNRVIGWSGLLLTSLLSTSALADNIGTSAEELGLSDYRHFVIYPRLEILNKIQRNCADQITIGGHFNNGGRFVDSAKKSIALCRPGQRRDIIRYACNFFAVNGGVVILK